MTNFCSLSPPVPHAIRYFTHPQKLAGQCAKLKCCLNYEVDAYVECQKRLPSKEITLETADSTYYYFKADILRGAITYSTDKNFLANEVTISPKRAFEIINMNKQGEKPVKLAADNDAEDPKSKDLLEQESVTRFDKNKSGKNKKKKKNPEKQRNANAQEMQNNTKPNGGNATETKNSASHSKKQKNKVERPKNKNNEQQGEAGVNKQLPAGPVKQNTKKLPAVTAQTKEGAKAENTNHPASANNNGGKPNRNNRRPKNKGNADEGGNAPQQPQM